MRKNGKRNKYRIKLSQEKAEQIRDIYFGDDCLRKWTITKLAKRFVVSRRQIGRILDDKCWINIEE